MPIFIDPLAKNRYAWAAYRASVAVCLSLMLLLATLGAGVGAPHGTMTPTGPATELIERFDNALLSVMKDADRLGYEGRYKILDPVIRQTFNIPLMTRIVVGTSWTGWSQPQRDKVTDAFGRFIVATYARRFDGYGGESFKTEGESPTQGGVLVRTELLRPNDTPITLNYLVRPIGDDWRAVDVFLTGTISELATRRSEFTAVIQRDGFDGLIDALENRIKILATATSD
jgi:phospholipid transport system substrate-binding protein